MIFFRFRNRQFFAKASLLGVISLLSLSSSAFGQASLSTHTLILPDTSYLGSTDTAIITVKNVGDSSYTGPVTIHFSTDTLTFYPFSLCSSSQITLNPSDTIQAICYLGFQSPHFDIGNRIVVVWSSGNLKALPADTARDSVHVLPAPLGAAAVSNSFLDNAFVLYPSIANAHIYLEYPANLPVKEHIRLLDIYGRRVYETDYNASATLQPNHVVSFDISHLKEGIYFVELSLPDNRKLFRKFIKVGM